MRLFKSYFVFFTHNYMCKKYNFAILHFCIFAFFNFLFLQNLNIETDCIFVTLLLASSFWLLDCI